MTARQVVLAEREHDREPLVGQVPGEEREQVAGRPVDPVDVLDDEHDRCAIREGAEQAEDPFEQARLGEARRELRQGRLGRGFGRGGRRRRLRRPGPVELRDERHELRAGPCPSAAASVAGSAVRARRRSASTIGR